MKDLQNVRNSINAPIRSQGSTSQFKRRFMKRLLAVLIGGMFLDGYILGILGPATGLIREDLLIEDVWIGLIAAAPLFGIFIGAPLAGWATDKFGRKPMFIIDMGLFLLASAAQFFVTSGESAVLQLVIIRLLMGVAIGGEYSIGWPLLSEFSPPKLRGRLLGVTMVAWYIGFMCAFIVGTVLHDLGASWKLILGSSTLLALILFLARIGLPESPSWLITKGRQAEAEAIMQRYVESPDMVQSITAEIDLRRLQEAEATRTDTALPQGSFSMLFSRQYWKSTLFTSGFWFCAVTPYFAIATFADDVLKQYGLAGGWTGGVGLSALATAGVITSILLIDKLGRRILTVPGQWICAVMLLVIGVWTQAPSVVVLALFLAFSFFNASYSMLVQVYPAELFPSQIRGLGMGFAAAISRVGAALGTFALPWAISHIGMGPSMIAAALIAFAGAILSQWLAPETKGKSLAETAATYSH
ncbi:sugar porter family MFS transporter [Glutamicibacter sp. JL.03c]|uniref:sugar porter family MFS transporter n=1 Tax=Glutamicibacter sp. JL.03c TaxID=2984842 RepID=UPI0021F74CEF|nr:sugar porter family MFS transporter [Glutamicibacter sp. JL.03c]UYQ78871.1 sugar porter family MFS transporter [Glutamicibacter sp. JL.03c]